MSAAGRPAEGGRSGAVGRAVLAAGAVGVLSAGLAGAVPSPALATGAGEARAPAADARPVDTPRDPRLTETSGLVDRGATVVLTNDSGSCA